MENKINEINKWIDFVSSKNIISERLGNEFNYGKFMESVSDIVSELYC